MKPPLGGRLWREVDEQPLELADGFGLIAAVDPLLKLLGVETALGVVAAEAFAGRLAIGIGGA